MGLGGGGMILIVRVMLPMVTRLCYHGKMATKKKRDELKLDNKFVSVGEAARMNGVSRQTIWRWVKNHRLRTVMFGGRKLILLPAWMRKDVR